MNATKILAIVLLVVGALGLVYGGFTYTSDVHRADIGTMHLKVVEKDYLNIPVSAAVFALVAGALLLGFGRKI